MLKCTAFILKCIKHQTNLIRGLGQNSKHTLELFCLCAPLGKKNTIGIADDGAFNRTNVPV